MHFKFHFKRVFRKDFLLNPQKSSYLAPELGTFSLYLFSMGKNKDLFFFIFSIFELFTGKKSFLLFSKKDLISFNIRKGDIIGISSLIRGDDFFFCMERLLFLIFPKRKDSYFFQYACSPFYKSSHLAFDSIEFHKESALLSDKLFSFQYPFFFFGNFSGSTHISSTFTKFLNFSLLIPVKRL